MRWLATSGYTPVTLSTLRENRVDGAPLPDKPVVLTFDDGYRDCVQYAADVLQPFRFTAIFFAVAGLVGKPSRWLLHECDVELPLAGWSELQRLAGDGFEFGAHSVTHPRLATLTDDDIQYELPPYSTHVWRRRSVARFLTWPTRSDRSTIEFANSPARSGTRPPARSRLACPRRTTIRWRCGEFQ